MSDLNDDIYPADEITEHSQEPRETIINDTCQNCGKELYDGQDFCPKCGTQKKVIKANLCGKCGTELQEGNVFCQKCGKKVGIGIEGNVSSNILKVSTNANKKVVSGVIGFAIIAIVIFSLTNKQSGIPHKDVAGNPIISSSPRSSTISSNPSSSTTSANSSSSANSQNGTYTESTLDELLLTLPLSIIKTKYTVQDEDLKFVYPDMLQAILKNNTKFDIKDAIVAFVAWDKNNLPVKLKDSIDFTDGSYIQ